MSFMESSRRQLMLGAGALALLACAPPALASGVRPVVRGKAKPLPLGAVRLRPSDYATAVEVNRTYLHRLSPDRLLHNFRKYAGPAPKATISGGWESHQIPAPTPSHYIT